MNEVINDGFLLEDFIGIYEVVAGVRLAIREGRLASHLGIDSESASGNELAKRIGARISALVDAKLKKISNDGTKVQQAHQRLAIYAAAALIDEIFILEENWPGQEAWLDELLEFRLFRSRVAGQRFFELAEDMVLHESHSPQLSELAAIFLLALRLGFHGRYRGAAGAEPLEYLRRRLFERVIPANIARIDERAFPQSYQFTVEGGEEKRLAPLRPWLKAAGAGFLAYLLLSSTVWLMVMQPFLNRH